MNVFLLHSRPFVFLRNHQNFSEFVSTALCCSAYPLLLLWLVPLAPCPLSIQNPCHLANYWSKWSFCAGHSSSSTPTLENQSFFMYLALCTKACSCWNRLGIGSLVSLKRNCNSTDILSFLWSNSLGMAHIWLTYDGQASTYFTFSMHSICVRLQLLREGHCSHACLCILSISGWFKEASYGRAHQNQNMSVYLLYKLNCKVYRFYVQWCKTNVWAPFVFKMFCCHLDGCHDPSPYIEKYLLI